MQSISLNDSVNVVEGKILARPSKLIKTPYVCDLQLINSNQEQEQTEQEEQQQVLAHTPSLGCNGMVDKEATVISVKRNSGKCDYGVICSKQEEKGHTYLVGVDPSLAEKFAGEILISDKLTGFKAKQHTLKTQQTYDDCRFDYCGLTTDNKPFICEIKNVSIAVYENESPKVLSKMDFSDRDYDSKIAVFPTGYKKSKAVTHSERALKHTNTLRKIMETRENVICMILFIVQRDDITHFEVSNGDPVYKEALKKANESGVIVRAISVKWVENNANTNDNDNDNDNDNYNITPICGNIVKVEL